MNFIAAYSWPRSAGALRLGEGPLAVQAAIARELGSPFVAAVLEAGERMLHLAPATAELIETWPGDPAAAALALRFNAALHALALRGDPPELSRLYRRRSSDFDGAIGTALARHDAFIAEWMRHPTQTNEVARAGALLPALMVAASQYGLPFELLELGASAGLNLNLAHYRYCLGGVRAGAKGSPVRIAPEWRGAPPPDCPVTIASARGVDLLPLDPADPATCERLKAYVWADQTERARRLRRALKLAQTYPPHVERCDAASWLTERLRVPQAEGQCRAVVHSMVRQYFCEETRIAVGTALARAGEQATATRPLIRIGFEWTMARDAVHLSLTSWPSGETRILAACHPYGEWIQWFD